eukprot:TRINITY_DN56445_c0_g1_i1.p1 TRINITY_DN56445_c0_g1~~TRINITY_DN56445_c0_g1_i1.p1  ORF type:complete len:517 (+),score=46.29 TRINITY_DN56445_c0_g1_i1:193-1743(+)
MGSAVVIALPIFNVFAEHEKHHGDSSSLDSRLSCTATCSSNDPNYVEKCASLSSAQACEQQSFVCIWSEPVSCDAGVPIGVGVIDSQMTPHPLGEASTVCGAEYKAHFQDYVHFSGAWLRFAPREHKSERYWKEYVNSQFKLDGIPDEALGTGDPVWTEMLYIAAHEQVLGCWNYGGKYWDTRLKEYGPDSGFLAESWPGKRLASAICAPDVCEREQVEAEVIPYFFGVKVLRQEEALPSPAPGQATALQITHWADMHLNFALLGVDGCGTTSVRRNLNRHPDLLFTNLTIHNVDEDFFFHDLGRRTLPLKDHTDKVAELHESVVRGIPHRKLGIYNPLLWSEATVRQILLLIPDIRLIIVICDPVDRYIRSFKQEMKSSKGERALQFSSDVKEWERLFGTQLFLLHQAFLRDNPREAYNALASFLGVAPFSPRTTFHRYNSIRGNQTDVCHNSTLMSELKENFSSEYETLIESMQFVDAIIPEELRLRQTRCDRPTDSEYVGLCYKSRCDTNRHT